MHVLRPYRLMILCACLLAAACNPASKLPQGQKLYTGASVELNATDVGAREKKVLRSSLQGMTRPRPNSRFLGIPFKLSVYNLFRNAKENSFWGRLRDRFGEPPVLLESVDLEQNTTNLRSHLENKGFFNAQVTGDSVVKDKKGSAEYVAEAGNQYRIDSLAFPPDSSDLAHAIRESMANTLLRKGDPFDLDVIKGERIRIDAFLKERGFYYFSPDYLLLQVDSTEGTNQVDMVLAIKPEVPLAALQAYRIDDVYIYSNYRINAARVDTSVQASDLYKGYYVVDRADRFKPMMFENIMQFQPGDLYNRTDHNQTLNRLINLNEFRFVRNRFEKEPDSAKLDAFYYLTPLPKKSLRAEVTATTKTNGLSGTQLTGNWSNRNTFRAGEHLVISAYVATEVQSGGQPQEKSTDKKYNVYRSGAEANLVIPRFVVPLFDVNVKGGFVPRTTMQLGYDLLNRRHLYTVNSYRGGLGYLWKRSLQKQHELFPISINYVQPLNVTDEYRDSVRKYPFLRHVIDSQFILGSTYNYNYNELATGLQKLNAFFFNGLVDVSGNVAGLLLGSQQDGSGKGRLLGGRFDQYIKLEGEGRYYRRIGLNSSWANRAILGYSLPYGNSYQLPYIKQYFVGGNNSVRAFRSRSLLGTYRDTASTTFLPDLTGDLKVEFNTEFRPKISGPLYGAFFIDAGNAWLKNTDTTRPGASFSKDWLKQLAIGAGVGIRLDIQLFVIRLDVATPLRKPWEDNPWVTNSINFKERAWRRENIVWNLAIGYPF